MGIFGGNEAAFLLDRLWIFLLDDTSDWADAAGATHLARLGRYIASRPQPPWVTAFDEAWDTFFEDGARAPVQPANLEPAAFVGAASVCLMAAESLQARGLSAKPPEQLGPLSDLCPYIARRWGASHTGKLPNLPVSPTFLKIFKDWAESKANLIQTSPAPSDRSH
jgi:hypothetical protein